MGEERGPRRIGTEDPLLLTAVDVWNPEGVLENRDVLVEGGTVREIRRRSGASSGRLALLPAGVDLHVHLRVPGQPEKETPETGLRAALHGGVGCVLSMPNTVPVIDGVETWERARAETAPARERYGITVHFAAAVTEGERGERPVSLEALAEAGVLAFTDDGRGVASDEVMDEVLARLAALGRPLLQHAEMPGHGGVLAPGPVQARLGLPPYLPGPEVEMVARDLRLLERHPRARYHVQHVSSRETLALVGRARGKGLRVTAEGTPHHLLFTSGDVREGATSFKINPPLRSGEDREALREALATGDLDWIATDHAPHEAGAKGSDFRTAAFGTTGLEACLRFLLLLHREGRLDPGRLVTVFSEAPARWLELGEEWGRIREGDPFRAVLVDPGAEPAAIGPADLAGLSRNSCFLDTPLPGRILAHGTPAGFFLLREDGEWRPDHLEGGTPREN